MRAVHHVYMAGKAAIRLKSKAKPTFFRQWREHRGMTLEKAAELVGDRLAELGHAKSYTHASLGRLERGEFAYKQHILEALAAIYRTDQAALLTRDPTDSNTDDLSSEDVAAALKERPRPRVVKLKGYVGAGAVAHFYALADEDFEEVEAPLGSTDDTIAVEIRGKSFGPLMDSWLVFYDDVRSPVTADLLNEICVVGLSDDRILIKQIKSDGAGGFNLVSNSNEETIYDAEIEWAAKVTNMRPR